jgi:hypothetical protein
MPPSMIWSRRLNPISSASTTTYVRACRIYSFKEVDSTRLFFQKREKGGD